MKISQKDQQQIEKNVQTSEYSLGNIAPKVKNPSRAKQTRVIMMVFVLISIAAFAYYKIAQRIQELQIKVDVVIQQSKEQSAQLGNQIKNLEQQLKQKVNQRSKLVEELEKQEDAKKQKLNEQKENAANKPQGVKLNYQPNKQALPINPLVKNAENKDIFDVLYKDRQQRLRFTEQRINYLNPKSNYQSANLIKYNLIMNENMLKEAIAENEKEWLRLQAKFKISSVKEELPFCIVSASFNNNAKFRIEANLNSIFSQNYTNFKQVIINDASTDGSNEAYRNYFSFYRIDPKHYVYIENKQRVTALQNIYNAAINICTKDSIVLVVDGDDQIIGRNTLKLFNWGFQTRKAGVLYSNFYFYHQETFLKQGFTQDYQQDEKKNNLYKSVPMKFSHLRGARAQLFHQIKVEDLQYKGKFFLIGADTALFYPLMELSCGRVTKIQNQFNLAYIVDTGINDHTKKPSQINIFDEIRSRKKNQCYRQFDQKMKK